MDYMDQSVSCRVCGKETSSIITKICLSCERAEKEAARKAEWDSKSDLEKCFSYLESWANPSHATFSSQTAAFVLNTFRAALSQQEDGELPPLPQSKTYAIDPRGLDKQVYSASDMREYALLSRASMPVKEQEPVAFYRDVRVYLEWDNSSKEDREGYMRREWHTYSQTFGEPPKKPDGEGWIAVFAPSHPVDKPASEEAEPSALAAALKEAQYLHSDEEWEAAQKEDEQAVKEAEGELISDERYLEIFHKARAGSDRPIGYMRGIRAAIAAYEDATPRKEGSLPTGSQQKEVVAYTWYEPANEWNGYEGKQRLSFDRPKNSAAPHGYTALIPADAAQGHAPKREVIEQTIKAAFRERYSDDMIMALIEYTGNASIGEQLYAAFAHGWAACTHGSEG